MNNELGVQSSAVRVTGTDEIAVMKTRLKGSIEAVNSVCSPAVRHTRAIATARTNSHSAPRPMHPVQHTPQRVQGGIRRGQELLLASVAFVSLVDTTEKHSAKARQSGLLKRFSTILGNVQPARLYVKPEVLIQAKICGCLD